MPQLTVVLAYSPDGLDGATAVPLGQTSQPGAVRAVCDALVDEARTEVLRWQGIDQGVFATRAAEFERLCKVLAFLWPEAQRPNLRVVQRREVTPTARGRA